MTALHETKAPSSPISPMLGYLTDPANALTAASLGLAFLGMYVALLHEIELGVAAVLWVFLIDHFDGVVAQRTPHRRRDAYQIGRHLDSLTDLASDCIFPALVLVMVSEYRPFSVIVALALVVIGALRLSFYNTFGAPGGHYVGVPVTYTTPTIAALFMFRPLLAAPMFAFALNGVIVLLMLLQLSRLPVPVVRGWMYAVVSLYAIGVSAFLVVRQLY
jgi:CDP-diacylglycerol--serine O-phosphatidyltransferase